MPPFSQSPPPDENTPIQHSHYSKQMRFGCIWLAIFVVFFGGWSVFGQLNGAVIASGRLIVEGKSRTLQHLDGGVIGKIIAKDGDIVAKGDLLVTLDDTSLKANEFLLVNRLYQTQARVDRLRAELNGDTQIQWSERIQFLQKTSHTNSAFKDIVQDQEKLFFARSESLNDQIKQLNERITQSKQQIKGYTDLIHANRKQLDILGQEIGALRTLQEKGYAYLPRILALEREEANLIGQISFQGSDIARTKTIIRETLSQIEQTKQDIRADILTQLHQTETELSDLTEQLTAAQDQLSRIKITAPTSGLVHNSTINTIGGVLIAGQPFMQIVPSNEKLFIEVRVSPLDIEQVYIGQKARANLSSFNQRTTPYVQASVEKISADTLEETETGISYFTARLSIDEGELDDLKGLILLPGMPVEVFIQTKKRSVIDYLIKPFTDNINRSLREE